MVMNISAQFLLLLASHTISNEDSLSNLKKVGATYMEKSVITFFADEIKSKNSSFYSQLVRSFSFESSVILLDPEDKFSIPMKNNMKHSENFVLLVSNKLRVEFITNLRDNQLWHAKSKILVVVENEMEVKEWIEDLWTLTRAVNVEVYNTAQQHFYSWYPYKSEECSKVITIEKVPFLKLFEPKINSNLNNCTLSAVVNSVIHENIEIGETFDVILLKTVTEKLNLNLIVESMPARDFLQTFAPDGTPIGFLKLLYENKIDLALGYVQRRLEFYMFLDFTSSYAEDGLSWFCPLPRLLTSIEKFQQALTITSWTWIGIALIAVLSGVCIISIALESTTNHTGGLILYTAGAYFSVPITIPNYYLYQFIFVILYLYSLHITTMYQSGLIYMLSNKVYEKSLSAIENGIALKYKFVMHMHVQNLVRDPNSKFWIELNKTQQYSFTVAPDLRQYISDGKTVFLSPGMVMERKVQGMKLYNDEGKPKMAPLKDRFMIFPIVMSLSPGHPLTEQIDKYILWLIEGGFCDLWLDNYLKRKKVVSNSVENHPLSFEGMSGIFEIVGITLCGSVLIFLLEIIWQSAQKKMCINRPKIKGVLNRCNKRKNILDHYMRYRNKT